MDEQLARLCRMSPREQAEYIYNNPMSVIEMTSRNQPRQGPPVLYEVKDGTRVVAMLDRHDYRLVLAEVQQAFQAITNCTHHSRERCECWKPYRNSVGYYRESRGVDHPIATALTFYWDLVEATAKDRPKKDQTTEALQQLTNQVQAIAEQQSTLAENSQWVGRKKASRVLGLK